MENRFFCRSWFIVTLLLLISSLSSVQAQPSITLQPLDQLNVAKGDNVSFKVGAIEDGYTLQYQWRLNGANISGATKSIYSLKSTAAANAGQYTCGVGDGKMAVESNPALLTFASTVIRVNDNFANRVSLGLFTNNYVRSVNTNASKESREPNHADNAGGKSVWFKWTPTGAGIASITTAGSSFNTLLAVYKGTGIAELVRVPSAIGDDGRGTGHTSKLSFNADGKSEYEIAVDGYNGANGEIFLSWGLVTGDSVPIVTNMPATNTITTSNGTARLSFTGYSGAATVAWLLNGSATAGGKGNTLTVDSVNDATVGDYTAQLISDGGHSIFTTPSHVQANIHDDGSTDTGAIALDRYADAGLVVAQGAGSNPKGSAGDSRGYTTSQIFSTVGGTKEAGEPNHCGQLGGSSMWFSYTPPTNALININTSGSSFDTILAVYTGDGSSFASLKSVDCGFTDDYADEGQPSVTFDGDSKTVYYIVVDGYNGETGTVHLNINNGAAVSITSPLNNQAVKAGSNAVFTVSAGGATPRTYQWQYKGANIPGATNSTYTVSNVQAANIGTYSVGITNLVSDQSSSATLSLLIAPTIATDATNQTAVSGTNVSFVVAANGSAPLSYQWRAGASITNITGGTNSTLTLTNVQSASAGSYRCVITNAAGAITSSIAILTVNIAPAITTNPTNKTVTAGTVATFTCQATGTAPLGYQWTLGGNPVAGGTTTLLTLNSAQTSDAGSYACVATNMAGSATSSAAVLTVNVPPLITANPTNQSATVNSTVTLVCTASGSPAPAYQWRGGAGGTNVTGGTGSSLVFNNVQTNAAGSYFCVVTNAAGAVTSAIAAITINVPPSVTTNPVSQTVIAGSNVLFTCQASGTGPLGYQWMAGSGPTNITGAISTSLTLTNVAATSAGNYFCVITNVAGAVTSTVASLVVNTPPAVTNAPVSTNVIVGSNVVFTCGVSGTAPLFYQWRGGAGGTNVTGATGSSLRFPSVQATDAGSYFCVVTNVAGAATSSVATLTVLLPPTITTNPVSQNIITGSNVVFTCGASGTGPLLYQWRAGASGTNITGATSSSLSLNAVQTTDAGSYFCIVSNVAGSAISATATLSVIVPPTVALNPTNQNVNAGLNAVFTCVVNGTAPLIYQWLGGSSPGTNITGATAATMTLTNVTAASAGSYWCLITNAASSATSSVAVLTVNLPASIQTNPTNVTVLLGRDTQFSCVATGTAPLTYQWRFGSTNIPTGTNGTLSIPTAQLTNAGSYSCVVSNMAGTATSATATLTVNFSPVISVQPITHSVAVGADAGLTVTASGSPAPVYQWSFNGKVTGNNSSALIIAGFQAANEGSYQVVVSNSVGSVSSSTAVMLSDAPLRFLGTRFNGKAFQLQMVGQAGSNYVFESTIDCDVWTPLQTNLATNGILILTDSNPPTSNRFYRTRISP